MPTVAGPADCSAGRAGLRVGEGRARPTLPAEVSSYGNMPQLRFRTPEPTATPMPRPTPLSPTLTPTATPIPVVAEGVFDSIEGAEYLAYCLTHYRQLLVAAAQERQHFRRDDVYAVGLEFRRLRPDCLARGFAPEPDFGLSCRTGWAVDGWRFRWIYWDGRGSSGSGSWGLPGGMCGATS